MARFLEVAGVCLAKVESRAWSQQPPEVDGNAALWRAWDITVTWIILCDLWPPWSSRTALRGIAGPMQPRGALKTLRSGPRAAVLGINVLCRGDLDHEEPPEPRRPHHPLTFVWFKASRLEEGCAHLGCPQGVAVKPQWPVESLGSSPQRGGLCKGQRLTGDCCGISFLELQ